MKSANVIQMSNPALVAYAKGVYKNYVKKLMTTNEKIFDQQVLAVYRANLNAALIEIDRRHIIVETLPKLGETK